MPQGFPRAPCGPKLTERLLINRKRYTDEQCTLAPTTPIFLPALITPLRIARARGASTSARSRYHPSVTSSSGASFTVWFRCPSVKNTLETHKAIGQDGGESPAAMSLNGGLEPPWSSLSYLDQTIRAEKIIKLSQSAPIPQLVHCLFPAPSLGFNGIKTQHPSLLPEYQAPMVVNPVFGCQDAPRVSKGL